jgi:chemosensory pili system protein ChpA (sensor histidine kinase/response regulator)
MKAQADIDFTTLNWVKQELDDTLKQARQALEAYVEDPSDKSQMRFCSGYLHQVQGTLRMVELYGAAMVVEEMERLANSVVEGEIKQVDDAYTVLMRGMQVMPDYLERLQGGQRDIPIILLPLLNDLRACRGEKLLTETALFSPDVSRPLPVTASGPGQQIAADALKAHASKLRLAYQFGLLKWFKNDDVAGNLSRLTQVLDRLTQLSAQIDARRLWHSGAGVLDGVRSDAVEASVAVKLLFGKIDREIKRLIDAGERSFAQTPPSDLIRGLLYYAAHAKPGHARTEDLKRIYGLEALVPSQKELEHARGALTGHNRALLDTVGQNIKDDLMRVKDGLDLYLRTASTNPQELAPHAETLHRVADTLGMLGLGVPRKVVQQQREILDLVAVGKQAAEEQVLLDVAGSLLYVESSLDDYIERLGQGQDVSESALSGLELPQAEVRRILDATMKEAASNIQQAKQDIVAFIESPWDHSKIEQIPRLMEEIGGALRMLNQMGPASLVDGVIRFTDVELLKHRRVPSADQLDLLADAMASIEYYLEAVRENRPNRDRILEVTQRSLESLGYWPIPSAEEAERVAMARLEAESQVQFPTYPDTMTTARVELSLEPAPADLSMMPTIDLPDLHAPAMLEAPAEPLAALEEPISAVDLSIGSDLAGMVVGETQTQAHSPQAEEVAFTDFGSLDLEPMQAEPAGNFDFSPAPIEAPREEPKFSWIEELASEPAAASEPAIVQVPVEEPPAFSDFAFEPEPVALEPVAPIVVAPEPTPAPAVVAAPVAPAPVAVPAPKPVLPGFAEGFAMVPSDDIDDEIREVFVEEVQEVLNELNKLYPVWKMDMGDMEKLKPIRRSFHTLKGSGRLVGALAIGEFSWKIENMLNRVMDKTVSASPPLLDCLDQSIKALPFMLDALRGEVALTGPGAEAVNIGGIMWAAEKLASGEQVSVPKLEPAESEQSEAADAESAAPTTAGLQETVVAALDEPALASLVSTRDTDSAPALEELDAQLADDLPPSLAVDPALAEILSNEALTHNASIRRWLDESQERGAPQPVDDELLRAVHTLNGAVSMVELPVLSHVLSPLESYLKRLRGEAKLPSAEGHQAIVETSELIDQVVRAMHRGGLSLLNSDELTARLTGLRDGLPANEPSLALLTGVLDEEDLALGNDSMDGETELESVALVDFADESDLLGVEVASNAAEPSQEIALTTEPFEALERIEAASSVDAVPLPAIEEAAQELEPLGLIELDSLELDETLALENESNELFEAIPEASGIATPELETLDEPGAFAESVIDTEPEAIALVAESDSAQEELGLADLDLLSLDEPEALLVDEQPEAFAQAVDEQSIIGLESTPAEQAVSEAGFEPIEDLPADLWSSSELSEVTTLVSEEPALEAGEATEETGLPSELPPVEDFEVAQINAIDDLDELDALIEHGDAGAEVQLQSSAEIDELIDQPTDALPMLDLETDFSSDLALSEAELGELAALTSDASFEEVLVGASTQVAENAVAEFADEAVPAEAFAEMATKPEGALPFAIESVAEPVAEVDSLDALLARDDDEALRVLEEATRPEPLIESVAEANVVAHFDAPRLADLDADPEGPLDLPDADPELVEIFCQEGTDILDNSDRMMAQLREAPENREIVVGLQRELHTLKGGARMAGISPIGDLSHAMESLFEAVVDGRAQAGGLTLEALERSFDRLHSMVQRVQKGQAIAQPERTINRLEAILEGRYVPETPASVAVTSETEAIEQPIVDVAEVAASEPAVKEVAPTQTPAPTRQKATALDEQDDQARQQAEVVRVKADLLDNLVNFAGEVSIYRSRLEAQIGGFRFNLQEFEQTVTRLREQLRKLEIETEAQIIARYQREGEKTRDGEQFDPLELDQFSTMQQLSRALAESVSDLVSLQSLMDDIARQSETLLLQQSRVSSELQEGLMRTRMVPFESLVPRLRRIVRQTAGELGKRAQLKVEGAQGEMDRTVLERMTAPLEHMLRNALAHGLETPQVRRGAGKGEEGTITIHVARDATEVVLRVSDDGAGMNRDAIRRKAIERGLLREDVQLSDRDLYQFILETGFSTAEQVSKISGRGVGMDVVNSEIKQLGGSLQIDSSRGKGSVFTVRLPFTLSVTQAILLRLAEHVYAVPMSSIAGVIRLARKDLDARLERSELEVTYAGEVYQYYDLGDLLGTRINHALDETQVPLLMTKTGDQRAAIRVSGVIGSKEIVVKSVGPQLSSVPGFFGATIMGDGSVVIILDLAPLVRHGVALRQAPELARELDLLPEVVPEPVKRQPLVMVVDDSITMRKVTTRVLERNDIEVITAKDGLDAVEQLQDRIPDLMLLDIEMPRMDGYETATYVRNDPRLKNIPIIMITSRTGDKHRQRAMDIGVDRYLGKPYQEADLLRNVQDTLKHGRTTQHS